MQQIKFSKYQGAGNDFVLIDNRLGEIKWNEGLIQKLSDRKFGIGSDGVILLEKDTEFDFYMRYFNPDGGQVGMCGNGSRCIGLFAHHLGIGSKLKTFRSLDGVHNIEVIEDFGESAQLKTKLINVEKIEKINEKEYFLNTGVNHYVSFCDDVSQIDILKQGSEIRYSKAFEALGGTNANFVERVSADTIKIRTYERGVENETLACGTGATASAIATHFVEETPSPITVKALGGDLKVYFEVKEDMSIQNIYLQGEAKRVFSGIIEL